MLLIVSSCRQSILIWLQMQVYYAQVFCLTFHCTCLSGFLFHYPLILLPSAISLLSSHCFPGFSVSAFPLLHSQTEGYSKAYRIPQLPSHPFPTLQGHCIAHTEIIPLPLPPFSPFIDEQGPFSPHPPVFTRGTDLVI